jgi:amine acid ABC transporter, permease protein, 3-TM region, His/Glu/Gln/Arg/opine family
MQDFIDEFIFVFIEKDRWLLLAKGLCTTLLITLFAVILGLVLGFLVAVVRAAHDTRTGLRPLPNFLLKFFNAIAKIYLTIIRGTPVVVQLLIIYFVIFGSVDIDKILVSVIAFGLNSGAYVAEIMRSGIMSVDKGQMEAGRSLGLSYTQTMTRIILPQAFKNVLPALGNEIIVLLKETSVSGFIAVADLTKGGDVIRSATYSAFFPLIAVALIYLTIVMILSRLVTLLERRLRSSDH